jgi:diguanylate cyclase (GGDEF)-like protein
MVGMSRDISERKKKENEIAYLSYHDLLTGLYNRSFFENEKRRLDTESSLPLSVIIADINGLKLINDAFGHNMGDRVLKSVAAFIKSCIRDKDIAARVGGDEFCIILPQTDSVTAQKICSNIYQTCGKYKNKSNKTFYPSISLGHSTKVNPDQSIDQVIKDAEDYMYQKKLLERNSTHGSIINSIQATMHESSNDTEEHSERLVKLSIDLGQALGLQDEKLLELDLLSRLHDIGKICIEERILSKPGKLTEEEWAKVRQHPEVGFKIAQASTELIRISELILNHHERWDGEGYPQGLAGESIPLLARILTVVDAYDAMTNDRPYRQALSGEQAADELVKEAGKQFDPEVVNVFLGIIS